MKLFYNLASTKSRNPSLEDLKGNAATYRESTFSAMKREKLNNYSASYEPGCVTAGVSRRN